MEVWPLGEYVVHRYGLVVRGGGKGGFYASRQELLAWCDLIKRWSFYFGRVFSFWFFNARTTLRIATRNNQHVILHRGE